MPVALFNTPHLNPLPIWGRGKGEGDTLLVNLHSPTGKPVELCPSGYLERNLITTSQIRPEVAERPPSIVIPIPGLLRLRAKASIASHKKTKNKGIVSFFCLNDPTEQIIGMKQNQKCYHIILS